MKTVTAYVANDGTLFKTADACFNYEFNDTLIDLINEHMDVDYKYTSGQIAGLIQDMWPVLVELFDSSTHNIAKAMRHSESFPTLICKKCGEDGSKGECQWSQAECPMSVFVQPVQPVRWENDCSADDISGR